MKTYILDACALIAFILDEDGAENVEKLLSLSHERKCALFINKINLLEIYYNLRKEYDPDTFREAFSRICALPITIIDTISDEVLIEAGRLKSENRISLADSIALAEAITRNASLVTADHHEFDRLGRTEHIKFHWIR
ncbi:MAG TPA: type II toxin-antitoxin system VapC family toxin [Spirochaetota bacterium]|nr:type II toxin-antitoxin system VapC family toxin [Spirochaetota bacterium]HOS38369.1 type II toxin-antitoxin system VapC family toxin [Spirochaetota bacterium]HPU90090.1 type II toxin-antitoxin system VapC family toxin [Spirochaetota bacterium]